MTYVRRGHHGGVRKFAAFGAMWLVAAAVAVAIAWQGVGIVTRQVTDDRPAPLAAAEVRALAPASDDGAGGASTTLPVTPSVPTTVTPAPGPPGPEAPAPTTLSGPTAPAGAPPTTAIRPGGTASSPPTTVAVSPTTTTPPRADADAPSETRTYNLTGGTVSLRFAPDGVTMMWATPKPGFEVEVEPEHVNGVQVRFDSASHRSRVSGWWDGGPRDETREDER